MFTSYRPWRVIAAMALLGMALMTPAAADAKPKTPPRDLYVSSYNGDCTNILSVIRAHGAVTSWEPVGGPCVNAPGMAIDRTIRTVPLRPGETGAEYTLEGVPTGTTYSYPDTIYMDIPEATTDGSFNYAGGYFDGTVYRFTRDWTDPVALFSTGLYLGGLAYDSHTDTLWVLDSRADFEGGLGEIRNYTLDGTMLSSFFVRGGATAQPFGLAYDAAGHTLWISRNVGFDQPLTLEQYTTKGTFRASVTTSLVGVPGDLEFALRR